MKTLFLILFFCDSFQLRCDRRTIIAHVGGEFLLTCTYENSFYFSKKYWCYWSYRGSCEILADSESVAKTKDTHRLHVVDAPRRLFVKVTNLQTDDSRVYWVGIDKTYSDIMVSITLNVTQAPVSKPRLWPLNSLEDRSTCWGQPVTVCCGLSIGTSVRYVWYRRSNDKDILLSSSSDLSLHCGTVRNEGDHYCLARNDVSSEKSDILSVLVFQPADTNCIYAVRLQDIVDGPRSCAAECPCLSSPGQPSYDCADRMNTASAITKTTTMAAATTTCQAPTDHLSQINQTEQDFFIRRAFAGLQLWYSVLRWGLFASLVIFLCVYLRCNRPRNPKNLRRKRMFSSRPDA